MYFDWGYHSAAPGIYNFGGVRDINLLLNDAQRVGLYAIARPGPYINAETDAGGLAGWPASEPAGSRNPARCGSTATTSARRRRRPPPTRSPTWTIRRPARRSAFPAGVIRAGQDNVVSVLVENVGQDESFANSM
ncbi:MAG: beta-galactosidase [Solirubrobacteraceae bacterium]